MKRKGFTLIEVIVGLCLLGLVSTVGFPIIQNSIGNYNRVKERQHMYYLCEMVVERLRSKDDALDYIIRDLEGKSELNTSNIGETDLGEYICKIVKTKETAVLMNIVVRIYVDSEMGNSQYVEYKAVIKR